MGFERLLVELGRFFAARVKAVRADRPKMTGAAIAARRPASAATRSPISRARGLFAHRPLRISACDSLALSYEALGSNQCQSSEAVCS